MAILTKSRSFWYTGLLFSLLGLVMASRDSAAGLWSMTSIME